MLSEISFDIFLGTIRYLYVIVVQLCMESNLHYEGLLIKMLLLHL